MVPSGYPLAVYMGNKSAEKLVLLMPGSLCTYFVDVALGDVDGTGTVPMPWAEVRLPEPRFRRWHR